MRTYLDDLDMTETALDAQFDWDCWDVGTDLEDLSELLDPPPAPLVVVSPDSPHIFALQHSLAPPLTPAPPVDVVDNIFADCLPPAQPPPPVTADSTITTELPKQKAVLAVPKRKTVSANSLKAAPTSLRTFAEDNHMDPFVKPTTNPMMTPPPAADTVDSHYHLHFGSTAFLPPHHMDGTYTADDLFPPGSLFCCSMIDQPPSPSSILNLPITHLDFHSDITSAIALPMDLSLDLHPPVLSSVTRICGQPRVFAFTDGYFVHRFSANDGSLMDSGANICITNLIGLLIDAVDIPLFTFSIGRGGGTPNIDDCCTKHGLLPLPLVKGSLYYQVWP